MISSHNLHKQSLHRHSQHPGTSNYYLSISRGVPAAEGAGDDDHHLFLLQVGSVVVVHAAHLGRKYTTENVVDDVGIVTGAASLSGVENGSLDSLLVVLAKDAGCISHQPRKKESEGKREREKWCEGGRRGRER